MKKSEITNFVILLLLVLVVLGCGVAYLVAKNGAVAPGGSGSVTGSETTVPSQPTQPTPPPEPTPPAQPNAPGQQSGPDGQTGSGSQYGPGGQTGPGSQYGYGGQGAEREPIEVLSLDFDTIYALHDPNEVVGSVAGRDVTWDEYFYWLHEVGMQAEQYIRTLVQYGQPLYWTDKLSSDSESTLAEYVVELTEDYCGQLNLIEAIAEESGATLSEEDEAEIADRLQDTIASACGSDATEEDFNALLGSELISREMYDRLERANYLYQNSFIALYGEHGEKVSDEDALSYLESKGYLCASHILISTQGLSSEAMAEKLEQAEALSEELRAISDDAERVARFAELKEQYCEDPGKTRYPDGYLFVSGEMVPVFEDGAKALADYEVSEPILSSYGYHVIIRLPLDPDMTMSYSEAGTALSVRAVWANEQFNTMMSSRADELVFTPSSGFSIDLLNYLKKDS